MKIKMTLMVLLSFLLLTFASQVFAANVEVTGNVSGVFASGSTIIFQDSTSPNTAFPIVLGPTGQYVLSIPQGTYNITVTSPVGNTVAKATQYNQKITSNTVYNTTAPASVYIPQATHSNWQLAVSVFVVLLILAFGVGYFFWKRKKQSKAPVDPI